MSFQKKDSRGTAEFFSEAQEQRFSLTAGRAKRADAFFFSAAPRTHFPLGSNTERPPLFSDGRGPGAVRELERMYGDTVTVSS
jgi:hypothetical protein